MSEHFLIDNRRGKHEWEVTMLRTIALATWITAVALPAYAAPKTEATGPFEFNGYSIMDTTGGVGLPRMNEICQTDLARTDARMATTKEYIESTNTAVPGTPAWINMFIVGAVGDGGSNNKAFDFSGIIRSPIFLTCGAWSTSQSSITGLSVQTDGVIRPDDCDEPLLVACSAPGQ